MALQFFKKTAKGLAKKSLNQLPLPVYAQIFRYLKSLPAGGTEAHRKEIMKASERLLKKLSVLDVTSLPISEYSKRYLSGIQSSLHTCLTKLNFVMEYATDSMEIHSDVYFLEYGGGTGLISMLAMEMGLKNVFYNDIYEVSCQDFTVVSKALGYRPVGIICGDTDAVVKAAHDKKILFSIVASYDVIEHIYDPESFYQTLQRAMEENGRIFMGSAANSFNPKIVRELSALHLQVEEQDRPKVWGHKERDSLKSYHGIRESFIAQALKERNISVPPSAIHSMATRTRGLICPLILQKLDQLVANENLSFVDPKFPTNTCDPLTGNWAEHLLDLPKLNQEIANLYGASDIFPQSDANRMRSPVIGLLTINTSH